MGQPKYTNLGRIYPYADIVKLDDELVAAIKQLEERYNKGLWHAHDDKEA